MFRVTVRVRYGGQKPVSAICGWKQVSAGGAANVLHLRSSWLISITQLIPAPVEARAARLPAGSSCRRH